MLGQRIRSRRAALRMTQGQLGQRLDIGKSSISEWENGKRAPSVEDLDAIARALDLGRYLLMGHGEEQTGGREKPSILADAMEAVLAAIYIDGGYEAARDVIRVLFANDEKLIAWRGHDDKSALQEYTQANGLELPAYAIIAQEGPDHDRRFTAQVSILGKPVATGVGNSKKSAEQAAAKKALEILKK